MLHVSSSTMQQRNCAVFEITDNIRSGSLAVGQECLSYFPHVKGGRGCTWWRYTSVCPFVRCLFVCRQRVLIGHWPDWPSSAIMLAALSGRGAAGPVRPVAATAYPVVYSNRTFLLFTSRDSESWFLFSTCLCLSACLSGYVVMYLSTFNSFRVIRCLNQCVSPKIAILTHFGFPWGRPWGNHAKCCMDGKRIWCL